jgi:hypothetical protein
MSAPRPLPAHETRLEFIRRYADDSGRRLARLRQTTAPWWEEVVAFFDVRRTRAWRRRRGHRTSIVTSVAAQKYDRSMSDNGLNRYM